MSGISFRKICPWCVQHEAAQRGEVPEDAPQPVIATPWERSASTITLTHVLFGANLAVFLAMQLGYGPTMDFDGPALAQWGNYGPFTLSGQWWRLFTYMFVHGGVVHIAMNMWCLWSIGGLCESLYGRWTYAAIYVITGIAGGLTSVGWNPGVLSVGASGALFGLTGALIASFYLGEFSFGDISIKSTLSSLLFFAGFSLFFGSVYPGIDNAAHLGGLISGLALGALIAVVAPQADAFLRRASILGLVALSVLAAGYGVDRWRGGPIRMGRAYAALAENEPDRAIAQLQAIIRQSPNLVQAHFALAQSFFAKDRYPQAEAEFKRVLELQPQNSDARFELGLVYLSERRIEDAKSTFSQLLASDANNADAHYGLGLTLVDQEKYQPAVAEFKTAIQLGPRASGIYYELGRAYASLKQHDDAIAAYLEGKEKEGDNPELEAALAEAYAAKGMTLQAEEARKKAVQLQGGPR